MKISNPYYDPSKLHHTPEGFCNLNPSRLQAKDFWRWQVERHILGLPKPPQNGYKQFVLDWWQLVDLSGVGNAVWWLGHASVLLRLQRKYILIDPVFSQRASPFSFAGPKRKTPASLQINQLPRLDLVLISHNHYDHLDRETIRQIARYFPDTRFVVPLGLKRWFRHYSFLVQELDWWQNYSYDAIDIVATPAQHWSVRTLWDRNRSLWCGWTVLHPNLRFYFSGDSGYFAQLGEIAIRLGPFDLAALPIGAYMPRWFMHEQHMDPQQAVVLYKQLGEPKVIPIHWGVFELSDECLDEPPRELARALNEMELLSHQFKAQKIGSRCWG